MKQRLFVDMDGTLAEFKQIDKLETLYEPGYFLTLRPDTNVLNAIKEIISNSPDIDVHILSSVLTDSKYALDEKNAWLDIYLPEVNPQNRIFPPCGENKKDYIPQGIKSSDCLLDDYTKNLNSWQPPAIGIKILNDINDTNRTWKFNKVDHHSNSTQLANDILSCMKSDELRHQNEINAALIHDNDIDLDKQKTREQHGFSDNKKNSFADRLQSATQKAAEQNSLLSEKKNEQNKQKNLE